MRIERSGLSFRKRRRQGCLSPVLLLGMLLGGLFTLSWNWIGQWWPSASSIETSHTDVDSVQIAFNNGDLNRTIALAQQVLAEDPANAVAVALLARALIYRSYSEYNLDSDRQSALLFMQEVESQHQNDLDFQAVYAFVLQANRQPGLAVEVANKVLDRNPEHAMARLALAMSYSSVGSHDIALRESQKAVQHPGWRMDSHRALAMGYSGMGDYKNALASIERAIRLNDRMIALYFERALYARQLGDADAASVAYFQVLAIEPGNIKARFRLCELSSMLRERDVAIDFCQQVTERAPQWADGWYQLGREYFLQGNFAQAQQNLNRCSTLLVEQDVPIEQRQFECWYLQGQAAEIIGDCAGLLMIYNEYRAMAASSGMSQTWIYPPEGPPVCTAFNQSS